MEEPLDNNRYKEVIIMGIIGFITKIIIIIATIPLDRTNTIVKRNN